jgi:beta-N-acetylhexosaminidase
VTANASRTGWGRLPLLWLLLAGIVTACGTTAPAATPAATASRPPDPIGSPSASATTGPLESPPPTPSCAARTLASMTLEQRAGQLFVLGLSGEQLSSAETAAIRTYHLGSVFLLHKRTSGIAVQAALSAQVQALATDPVTAGVRFFVAADQEGGRIQRLNGEGFTDIPSALAQGALDPADLETRALLWGIQLAQAGVNVDFAPVMDVVPPGMDSANKPIGSYRREFGHDPETVGTHGAAVVRGMSRAGIATTLKHFPGLGRVAGNTDTTAGVVDSVTTMGDPYLAAFQDGIDAGAPFVMMSLASYSLIDPGRPAAFSPIVIGNLLRGRLGFKGVVVSDDLGSTAATASIPAAQRATRFISAGGELIVVAGTGAAGTMAKAVVTTARADPAFLARLDAAALHVLQTKEAYGLLPCS